MNSSQTDVREYLEPLIRQKAFIAVFCISVVLSSVTLTYITSEKYEAETMIYYRPVETSVLRQKNVEALGAPAPIPQFKVISHTLQNILKSDVILLQVVEQLKLYKKDRVTEGPWIRRMYQSIKDFVEKFREKLFMILKYGRIIEDDEKMKAVRELRKNIYITFSKESYVYTLKAKDKYPERAAKIVDLAGVLLVQWLSEQDYSQVYTRLQFFEKKLMEKAGELSSLFSEWQKMHEKSKFVSIPEESESGVKNRYELEIELARLNAQISKAKEKICELDEGISGKTQKYVDPDDYHRMVSERLFENMELNALLEKQKSLEQSFNALKERLQGIPAVQKKMGDIDVQIKTKTREYENLKDLYVEALVDTSAQQSEIEVLHPANVPAEPVQPIKIYHVGVSVILSVLFAGGLAYIFAFFNITTFFDPHDALTHDEGEESQETEKRQAQKQGRILFYILVIGTGIVIAGSVFYLLRKIGY